MGTFRLNRRVIFGVLGVLLLSRVGNVRADTLDILLEDTPLVRCEKGLQACAPRLRIGALSEPARPTGGPKLRWKGIVLSEWINRLLSRTALSDRSQVDVLVLKDDQGRERLLPRWVVTRYPILVATEKDGKPVAPAIVLPWTSRPKLTQEELPLEALALSNLREIQLSSWKGHLGDALLQRRTDPVALRGEKLHGKNCVVCHSAGLTRKPYTGLPQAGEEHHLGASAEKSLKRYFETLESEHAGRQPSASRRISPWSRQLVR